MSKLEQIEAAIVELSPEELRKLARRIAEIDQQRWDEQLERDVAAGRLDFLADEAIADFKAGRTREI